MTKTFGEFDEDERVEFWREFSYHADEGASCPFGKPWTWTPETIVKGLTIEEQANWWYETVREEIEDDERHSELRSYNDPCYNCRGCMSCQGVW